MFHKSNLGKFGDGIPCDMEGYVPEEGDGPFDLAVDHGAERAFDRKGRLTSYGRWWRDEGFREWKDSAIRQTQEAEAALRLWQEAD